MLAASVLALAVAGWTLSPQGLGPIRIGMTEPAVERLIGAPIEDDRASTNDARICHEGTSRAVPNVFFLFEQGRLSRIALARRGDIRMPDGIGIGSYERELRRLYGRQLRIEPADYDDPGHSLLRWERPGKRGLRVLTDATGRIRLIYAGASSIQYIEGCL